MFKGGNGKLFKTADTKTVIEVHLNHESGWQQAHALNISLYF